MVVENLCFAAGLCFVAVYAASLGTSFWYLRSEKSRQSIDAAIRPDPEPLADCAANPVRIRPARDRKGTDRS